MRNNRGAAKGARGHSATGASKSTNSKKHPSAGTKDSSTGGGGGEPARPNLWMANGPTLRSRRSQQRGLMSGVLKWIFGRDK